MFSYLEAVGGDGTLLLEHFNMPEEFLRDTSYWLQADEMESFLERATELYSDQPSENLLSAMGSQEFVVKVAHSIPEVRSWGLLDSVLRMMPKPQDILAQPERFLSYFISPQPPVEHLRSRSGEIAFDLPVSSDLYPLTTLYLKSAFEMLPVFVGKPRARAKWNGIHFHLDWEEDQRSILKEVEPVHQLSAEMIRSVVASLEQTEKDLSGLRMRQDTPKSSAEVVHRAQLKQEIARLADYMVRAQQIVTLMVTRMGPQTPWVRDLLNKVDWERVTQQFPETVEYCQKLLKDGALVTSVAAPPVANPPQGPGNLRLVTPPPEVSHVTDSIHPSP